MRMNKEKVNKKDGRQLIYYTFATEEIDNTDNSDEINTADAGEREPGVQPETIRNEKRDQQNSERKTLKGED